MARGFIQQQPDPAPQVRSAQEAKKVLEVLLTHIRATEHNTVTGLRVDRSEQDPFRILPADGDDRLLSPQRPSAPENWEQAQDRFIFKEQDCPRRHPL